MDSEDYKLELRMQKIEVEVKKLGDTAVGLFKDISYLKESDKHHENNKVDITKQEADV